MESTIGVQKYPQPIPEIHGRERSYKFLELICSDYEAHLSWMIYNTCNFLGMALQYSDDLLCILVEHHCILVITT